jgi:hypothetical protein
MSRTETCSLIWSKQSKPFWDLEHTCTLTLRTGRIPQALPSAPSQSLTRNSKVLSRQCYLEPRIHMEDKAWVPLSKTWNISRTITPRSSAANCCARGSGTVSIRAYSAAMWNSPSDG